MSQLAHHVYVGTDGLLKFVYDDELAGLLQLGTSIVERASHVEPTPQGGWSVDLSPSGGPVVGQFPLRGSALQFEHQWLDARFRGQ